MSFFFNSRRTGLRWLPALCFATAIFIFSATPGDEVHESYHNLQVNVIQTLSPSTANTAPLAEPVPSPIDWLKAAHGVGYFCLGVSVLYALSSRSRWSPSIALILCCLYSITDELHQMFTPGRSASPEDILLDTVGALMGVAVMLGLMASRKYFRMVRDPKSY